MDSYHGNSVPYRHPVPDRTDEDDDRGHRASDDDITREPPPASVGQDERRMQVRAYNCWASLLGELHLPRLAGLTAADMPGFADYTVILDISQNIANPTLIMLGEKLARESGVATTIARLSDVPGRSLLARIADHTMPMLASEAPIGFEAEFVNQRGRTLLYRGILLPFSSDGKHIHHIMGVINWKEVADPIVTAGLRQELATTVEARQAPSPNPALGAWADGPVTGDPSEGDIAPAPDAELADWLAAARQSVLSASALNAQSRAALYAAIGRAWDVALVATTHPRAFSDAIAAAGLGQQARAPTVSLVRLLFGAAYDNPQKVEIALALAHARRQGLGQGMLEDFLKQTPGGLRRIASDERQLRQAERLAGA